VKICFDLCWTSHVKWPWYTAIRIWACRGATFIMQCWPLTLQAPVVRIAETGILVGSWNTWRSNYGVASTYWHALVLPQSSVVMNTRCAHRSVCYHTMHSWSSPSESKLRRSPCMVCWASVWHGSVITLPCHTLTHHTMHGGASKTLPQVALRPSRQSCSITVVEDVLIQQQNWLHVVK